MLIPVYNPATDDLEKSYLLSPYSAGVTSIQVKNSNRFAVNDRIMLGEMGQEKTEVVTVSAVNVDGSTMTTGPTLFAHSTDDPVFQLRFDQVKFYRSVTTSDGSYTVISTQALDVDNADLTTKYDDVSGLASYYYKFTFFHSISGVESAFSDIISGVGWRRDQVGNIITEFLTEVGDLLEQNMTRTEVLGYFNDVNDDLTLQVAKPYNFLKRRQAFSRTANRNYLDYPTDTYSRQTMWKFDYMDYNFVDSTVNPVTNETTTIKTMSEPEFRNNYSDNTIDATTVTDKKPEFMCLDDSVLRFRFSSAAATSSSNVFYLHYWKFFDVINSEGDSIETPTPRIYKLYAKSQYYAKRAVSDPTMAPMANRYDTLYTAEKIRYKMHNRKDVGSPQGFRPKSATQKDTRR